MRFGELVCLKRSCFVFEEEGKNLNGEREDGELQIVESGEGIYRNKYN